jgi:hypothetical protein
MQVWALGLAQAMITERGLHTISRWDTIQINYYSYGPGQSAANPNDSPQ